MYAAWTGSSEFHRKVRADLEVGESAPDAGERRLLEDLGADIQWVHSYVVYGMTYCVYNAPDEELLREHARMTGFPCNRIIQVRKLIGPETGRG